MDDVKRIAAGLTLTLLLSGCNIKYSTPRQQAFEACVSKTANPFDCANAVERLYPEPAVRAHLKEQQP